MEQSQIPPIIIPGFVAKKPISHTSMVLYGLIFSLQREEGYAYASNAYYAESLGLSIASVKRYLKELVDARLILIHLDRKATDLVQRKIFLYSAMTAFRAYEQEGGQLKSEPYIQDTSTTLVSTPSDTSGKSDRPTRAELTEAIEPIYKSYPRKIGKQLAIDRLFQRQFKWKDVNDLATAVQNYADYCRREKMEEKFILHFSTFIGRWRDWVDSKPPTPSVVSISTPEELLELYKPKTWKVIDNEK
jgi:hypothetical protein